MTNDTAHQFDLFAEIADERRDLAAQFRGLPPERRSVRSLCSAWTVQDVLAHLVMPLEVGTPRMVLEVVLAGGNFDRANERVTRRLARRPYAEIVDVLQRKADTRFTPPGAGPEAPLVDVLVHGLDIRRPLGLTRDVPAHRQSTALSYLATAPSGFVPKGLLDGLRFEATDLDWSHGAGPVVRGTGQELLLVCTGRPAGLTELTGDGLPALRSRLTSAPPP